MEKTKRLKTILEIINEETISNQQELQSLLIKKGIDVTQATLSRDIKQLGILKAPNKEGRYSYTSSATASKQKVEREKVAIEFSGNLAIIKTRPGYAMAIAAEIDAVAPKEIIGTIAGDDTILIIPREGYNRQAITTVLDRLIK